MKIKSNIVALILALVTLAVAAGVVFQMKRGLVPLEVGYQYSPPKNLRSFELIDESDNVVTNQDFGGHWTLVFFGYTFCPDVCPTTMAQLTKLLALLEEASIKKDQLDVWFVSVDPERDTPEVLKNYTDYFDSQILGLTASEPAVLQTFANQLGVVFLKNEQDDGTYSVDHSSSIALINQQGQFEVLFRPEEKHQYPIASMADDIILLLDR